MYGNNINTKIITSTMIQYLHVYKNILIVRRNQIKIEYTQ